jgi:hypothetical protein
MMATSARQLRYTRNIRVIRNRPNSGMNFLVASPVWRSSQASSQGVPTRRTALKGAWDCSRGSTSASMAESALSRSAADFTSRSSPTPK